jgi:uracil-DNA glycosylase
MSDEISYDTAIEDTDIRRCMESISRCREENCPVPIYHPFYAVPASAAPFYYGKRPCMPVVPTLLCKGRVMILGFYPTCRFATIQMGPDSGVPVRDIDEPFENSRYFDTYLVRDVRSGTVLFEEYLVPLGLAQKDLWITNLIKCFLFKPEHITRYKDVNWNDPLVDTPTRDKWSDAAKRCFELHLAEELDLCKPKLVLVMGSEVCRMVFSNAQLDLADDQVFRAVRGKPLRAGQPDPAPYVRNALFGDRNLFVFNHPAGLLSDKTYMQRHREQDIPAAGAFLDELLWS